MVYNTCQRKKVFSDWFHWVPPSVKDLDCTVMEMGQQGFKKKKARKILEKHVHSVLVKAVYM